MKQYQNIKTGSRSEAHDKPCISAGIRSLTMYNNEAWLMEAGKVALSPK